MFHRLPTASREACQAAPMEPQCKKGKKGQQITGAMAVTEASPARPKKTPTKINKNEKKNIPIAHEQNARKNDPTHREHLLRQKLRSNFLWQDGRQKNLP